MSDQSAVKKTDKAEEKRKEYIVNLKRTLLPVATGVLLGIVSLGITTFISGDYRRVSALILVLVFIGIYIHRWTLPMINASSSGEAMQFKDWLYTGFLVFMTWYLTWTMLMNL